MSVMSTNLVSQLFDQVRKDELSDRSVLKSMAYRHFVAGIEAVKNMDDV